jgi:MSHA biogenesis protein MshQ
VLPVLMEAQYYNGSTFITNAADNCTTIANNNVAFAFTGNLNACETAVNGAGILVSGRRTLVLSPPGNNNDGAATLTVNLSNATLGSTCTAVGGAGPAAAGANLPWLQGNWSGGTFTLNPSGRATFGVFRGSDEVIFIRENF